MACGRICDSWNDHLCWRASFIALCRSIPVQAQMRTAMMNHIMTLPLGYIESREKELVDSKDRHRFQCSNKKHIWHIPFQIKQFPSNTDRTYHHNGSLFDWRSWEIMCLIPAAIEFVFASSMSGKDLAKV